MIEIDNKLAFDSDADHHLQAVKLALRDLNRAFEYVEPHSDNTRVFSHRFYELLLRACTEFESTAKTVLIAKEVSIGGNANIQTYFKLFDYFCLDRWFVQFNRWNPEPIEICPFAGWVEPAVGPKWYRGYNKVKHSRRGNFSHANLDNVVLALSGVIVLVAAAYGTEVFADGGIIHGRNTEDLSVHWINELGIEIGRWK